MEAALREPSIAVREATLDMLGKYILLRPEFVERWASSRPSMSPAPHEPSAT